MYQVLILAHVDQELTCDFDFLFDWSIIYWEESYKSNWDCYLAASERNFWSTSWELCSGRGKQDFILFIVCFSKKKVL